VTLFLYLDRADLGTACGLPSYDVHGNHEPKQELLLTSQVRLALLVRPLELATATATTLDQRLAIV
jgi:hypothetical protein